MFFVINLINLHSNYLRCNETDFIMIATQLAVILIFFSTNFELQVSQKKHIDKYVSTIDKALARNELTEKTYPERSLYGGVLTGYYRDQNLVLIMTDLAVALSNCELCFYLENDSLVFVRESVSVIQEPDNLALYIESHTDKNGNTDLSKLPLSTDDENHYYFSENKIVGCKLTAFNKKYDATEAFISDKNSSILKYFSSFIDELGQIPR